MKVYGFPYSYLVYEAGREHYVVMSETATMLSNGESRSLCSGFCLRYGIEKYAFVSKVRCSIYGCSLYDDTIIASLGEYIR